MARGQFDDERVGEAGERIVGRIAGVSMVDAHAIGSRNELDDLPCVEGPVRRLDRGRVWRPMVHDGRGDLTHRAAHRVDTSQVALRDRRLCRGLPSNVVGTFLVDHAAIDEPSEGVVEGRKPLRGETVIGVVGVQEVEGVVEVDVVGMTHADGLEGGVEHLDNHNTPIDRLRARGYITQVTDKTYETGYDERK